MATLKRLSLWPLVLAAVTLAAGEAIGLARAVRYWLSRLGER